MARQDGADVEHGHAVDRPCRNALESTRQTGDVGRHRRLGAPDDDVLAPCLAPAALVEQTMGLADAGGIPEKDLELPAAFRPLGRLGGGATLGISPSLYHGPCLPPNHHTRPIMTVV